MCFSLSSLYHVEKFHYLGVRNSICSTISFWFLTIDTLWGAVVPGYRLHLESEKRSVKVETWVTGGVWGVLHHVFCAGDFIVLFALPRIYTAYFQEMSPELLGSWQNTAPCECWGHLPGSSLPPQDQPWHLPSNDQVHLLPKKYCWLFLNVLRAPSEIPNGRYDCREHSVCCVLQQLRRSRALRGSPGADHGGCCAVGMGRSQREENLQAGFFFLNFCPPKICSLKKNYNFFFDSLIK